MAEKIKICIASVPHYTVIKPPTNTLVRTVTRAAHNTGDRTIEDAALEFPVTAASAADVATVYTCPANEVTSPPADVARVIASPLSEVIIVRACPPTAGSGKMDQDDCVAERRKVRTGYGLKNVYAHAGRVPEDARNVPGDAGRAGRDFGRNARGTAR